MSSQHTFPVFPPTPEGDGPHTLPPFKADASSSAGAADYSYSHQVPLNVVETPTSPSSAFALSRFEFETGCGNEGTKILMAEWDSTAVGPRDKDIDEASEWEVTWDGKTDTNVLPVRDTAAAEAGGAIRRMYFLLPPGVHIPTLVNIQRRGETNDQAVLRTKPMPAIFPANLASTSGRGVLHSIWARQRLADLAAEIAAEMQTNSESIGLQIALQEQAWISEHFAVSESTDTAETTGAVLSRMSTPQSPQSSQSFQSSQSSQSPQSPHDGKDAQRPTTPRSPGGGKLGEKLRGLRLATSPAELEAASQAARTAPRRPALTTSLDAVMHGGRQPAAEESAADGEDELFALPLSPRSPEMAKSPFSIL